MPALHGHQCWPAPWLLRAGALPLGCRGPAGAGHHALPWVALPAPSPPTSQAWPCHARLPLQVPRPWQSSRAPVGVCAHGGGGPSPALLPRLGEDLLPVTTACHCNWLPVAENLMSATWLGHEMPWRRHKRWHIPGCHRSSGQLTEDRVWASVRGGQRLLAPPPPSARSGFRAPAARQKLRLTLPLSCLLIFAPAWPPWSYRVPLPCPGPLGWAPSGASSVASRVSAAGSC